MIETLQRDPVGAAPPPRMPATLLERRPSNKLPQLTQILPSQRLSIDVPPARCRLCSRGGHDRDGRLVVVCHCVVLMIRPTTSFKPLSLSPSAPASGSQADNKPSAGSLLWSVAAGVRRLRGSFAARRRSNKYRALCWSGGPAANAPGCLRSPENRGKIILLMHRFVHTLTHMEIEFDPDKAAANPINHAGVTFEEAKHVLLDPYALTREDTDSLGETRFVSLGIGGNEQQF